MSQRTASGPPRSAGTVRTTTGLGYNPLPAHASIEQTQKRDALARAGRRGLPDVEVGADELDKTIDQRGSDDEADYLLARDPMMDAVNRVREPGTAYKFLNDRVCAEIGTEGYETVLERGEKVRVGEMFLGKIPQRIADRRLAHAAEMSEQLVRESADTFEQGVDKLKREAAGMGLRVLDPGELMHANATENREYFGQARGAGLKITRGE